jgi:hypothetical protein
VRIRGWRRGSNCYDRDRFENDGVVSEITSNPKTATVNIATIISCPPDTLKEEQESDQKTALHFRSFKVSLQAILRENGSRYTVNRDQ